MPKLKTTAIRRKLECAALFCDFILFFFFFSSLLLKHKEVRILAVYCFFSALLALCNDTSLLVQRCSACFLQKILTCLRFTWREDVKKLRYIRSERSD